MTGTTHKALRGPRGGLILSTERFAKDIDRAIFPNAQGGPIESQIAAKAVSFHEAMQPGFRAYTDQIVTNASAMATAIQEQGLRVVSGGTDNHLFLVDLRSVADDLDGKEAAKLLDGVGITLNFNTIPFDPRPPFRASGLRIGTPAMTSQGMKEDQAAEVATLSPEPCTDERTTASSPRWRRLSGSWPPSSRPTLPTSWAMLKAPSGPRGQVPQRGCRSCGRKRLGSRFRLPGSFP